MFLNNTMLASGEHAFIPTELAGVGGSVLAPRSVDINDDGDTIVAGFANTGTAQGLVRVYKRTGTSWAVQADLVPYTGSNSLSGTQIACSADGNTFVTTLGGSTGGFAVYTRSGTTWTKQQDQAYASQPAKFCDMSSNGKKFIFSVVTAGVHECYYYETSTSWPNSDKIYWCTPGGTITNISLSKDGSKLAVLVGSTIKIWNTSTFTNLGNSSTPHYTVSPPYTPNSITLSADGSKLIFGAAGYNTDVGRVYTYVFDGSNYVSSVTTDAVDAASGAQFGRGVATNADDTYMMVSAPYKNTNKGAVYIYKWSGSDWVYEAQYTNTSVGNIGWNSTVFAESMAMDLSGSRFVACGAENNPLLDYALMVI